MVFAMPQRDTGDACGNADTTGQHRTATHEERIAAEE
jgi:hypothetical protein